ncbi:NfeD family protein [Glaciecola sp. 1036]|uniref:NfeD family protein n=1 Tax=Alteromonadaceae TaxID=72275 RepID=UPI003CFD92DA
MQWLAEHFATSLLILGLVILAIEVLILGFATFFLSFVGIAMVITSVLISTGVLSSDWFSALISISVLTLVLAIYGYKPLRRFQEKVSRKPAKNDLVGHSFTLEQEVGPDSQVNYRYSGINWILCSKTPIPAGTLVEVEKTEVGKFYIRPKN